MKIASIFFLTLLCILSCAKKHQQSLSLNCERILVRYSDSSYNKPTDSLCIKENDTVYYTKRFPLQGFFKIIEANTNLYSRGKIDEDKKIGLWNIYQIYLGKWVKSEEHNYNKEGRLDGEFVIYDVSTKKTISIHQYRNGEESGIQKDFYPSGKLHIQYEKDTLANFINTYVVYTQQGSELFKTDLGKKGNGYIKFYDKDNKIEWEGNFINKKKQGLHKQYISDYGLDREVLAEKLFYKDDSLISHTKIFLSGKDVSISGNKLDSIVYQSLVNGEIRETYYYRGNVVKQEEIE